MRKEVVTLFEDDALKLQMADGDGDYVLVAFTGVGHALGGVDVQQPEFLSLCSFGKVFWVIDKKRSWGNNLNIEAVSRAILNMANGKPLIAVGNSMGGFLAILLSRHLHAKKILAFTPQWSINPKIVPEEKRWLVYRKDIRVIRYPDLSASFSDECQYAILHGAHETEAIHSKFFRGLTQENVETITVSGVAHDVARYLKERGCLQTLLADFFKYGSRVQDTLARAGVSHL